MHQKLKITLEGLQRLDRIQLPWRQRVSCSCSDGRGEAEWTHRAQIDDHRSCEWSVVTDISTGLKTVGLVAVFRHIL